MWFKPSTQKVFGTHWEIRADFPQTSFPSELTDAVLESIGVYPMVGNAPAFDPDLQTLTVTGATQVDGQWQATYDVQAKPLTQDQINAIYIARFDKALKDHLDATAQARRWDSRITLAVRAGYPNPWQQEAISFGTWMDSCNAFAYTLMAEVQAGTRPLPATTQELIDALPVMVWPA